MCPRQRPPEEKLQAAAEDVNYEIGMLFALAGKLIDEGLDPDVVVHNAEVEAFLIHARALYMFFYDDQPRATDIVATDYLPRWRAERPVKPPLLTSLSDELVGKRVAHLTLHRIERRWYPIQEAALALLGVTRYFLDLVPQDLYPQRAPLPTTGWAEPVVGPFTVTTSATTGPTTGPTGATTSASLVGEQIVSFVKSDVRGRPR